MKLSSKTWLKYINRLRRIDERVAKELRAYIHTYGDVDPEELIQYAYSLATRYGEAATAYACEMYDAVAEISGVTIPIAEPAPVATYAEVAKTVRGTTPEVMPQAVSRLIKRSAADTILNNALRDGAQIAWIPSGDSCAFCIMLASNGWRKASKSAIKHGHAEHIHSNCDCMYAVRFTSDLDVEGYDPGELYEQYLHAYDGEESLYDNGASKLMALRHKLDSQNRDKINAQKRALYARKKGQLNQD